ncbi:hypothetical protein P1J78_16245 [Psychromarinibacter sp. C21-152]|uniref:Uncharacterized protein n=1 Tax=Psychromarinibacter sediminicola TaxID=3033385 RepID=A0AAE3NUF4_9RHOB|nr:hypothetical protein [Psychromarinibacter sediminicola]MDF0602292.1 hypothetical protein [Psychromarinibacter sediminicola]
MRQGTELCLRNYRTPDRIAPELEAAGYTLTPGMDHGSFDVAAPGLWGVVVPADAYCTFQSEDVPLAAAQAMGEALADTLFPGQVQPGHPERGMASPCNGISIFAPQRLIWVHYAQAGNSGECVHDGTSAIIVNM